MRTIKRQSIKINIEKNKTIQSIACAYAKEKRYWLLQFQQIINIPYIKNHRIIRNNAVKSKYRSPYGLQARQWKLALQDAAEIMDKYWQSLFEKIRSDIYKSSLSDTERHYAFWLLKDYARFTDVLLFKAPNFKTLTLKERRQVVRFLNRKIRCHKKQLPKVKKNASFVLDDNCYRVFLHEARQYLDIMTLTPRKRLAIPLSGYTAIKGNIRIVLIRTFPEMILSLP